MRLVRVVGLPALAALVFLGAWWLFESVFGAARDTALALAGMILAVVSIGQTVWAGHTAPSPAPGGGQPGWAPPAAPSVDRTASTAGASPRVVPPPPAQPAGYPSYTPAPPAWPPAPAQPWVGRRPSVVSAASGLLYSCSALMLASVGIAFASAPSMADAVTASNSGDSSVGTTALAVVVASAGLEAVMAIGTGVLGVLVGKGNHAARVLTFVLVGFWVVCLGCSLLGAAVEGTYGSDPDLQRVRDTVPAWQSAVSTGASLIMFVAMFAVIVLLALPSSNRYFRRTPLR